MLIKDAKHTVLVISDTQLPFHHQDSIPFLETVRDTFRCDKVIHIGDFFDMHALSDYDPDPDGDSAGVEYRKAINEAKKYYKAFPKCQLVTSNHDVRSYKRAMKSGIPKAFLKGYHEWMQFPKGWSINDSVEIDCVRYIHGEGFSGHAGARNAAVRHMQSTVIGHIHSHAGVQYIASDKCLYFGMNVGCLIDRRAYAFAYAKKDPTTMFI